MLEHIRIRNYALIEELKIDFSSGFNVLTGETGAGKSIILGALNLILGEKAYTEYIRSGEQKAFVEALFDISKNFDVQSLLNNLGIEFDISEPLIIRREFSIEGKSRSYINSTPVPVAKLKTIGDYLIDIHGQHEHQSLFKVNTHIDLIDKFGKLEKDRGEIKNKFLEYKNLQNKLEKLMMNETEKARLIDLLKFSIEEIENADLQKNEDIDLEKEYMILSNQEKISTAVESSYGILYSDENDIYSRLGTAINALGDIEKYDSGIVSIKQNLEEALYQIEDAVSGLREYKSNYNFSPERLDTVIERMELIKKLKKKYGETIEDILLYKEKCLRDLEAIEQSEEEIEKTKSEIVKIEHELSELSTKLSGRRRVVAKLFEEKIMTELKDLDMGKSIFKVSIKYIESPTGIVDISGEKIKLNEKGIDNIEFMIATNAGESIKPLNKIASGGEISRVMLALKTILNEVDKVETLIFDEIDVGIGGKTADVVGKKIKFIGNKKQVISITHQAQIARYANKHFVVSKIEKDNRTVTFIKDVSGNDRIEEIARMIGGERLTDTTLQHAKELLEG